MVVTPLRLFLFVVAAFLAAAGTAYYTGALEAYFAPASRQVAQEEGKAAAGSDAAGSATRAPDETKVPAAGDGAGDVAASTDASPQESSRDAKGDRVVVPAFDVVRVEPDGSMVIAGKAAPQSNVEIVSGSTIVGKAQSGPDGDFVVVLDEPLKPGNYQIVLRATSPGDVVATSKETAVVSVPDNANGEVLALVEEPGKPSRLITKPAATQSDAGNGTAKADNAPADEGSASQSAGSEATQDQSQVATAQPSQTPSKDVGSAGSAASEGAGAGSGAASATDDAGKAGEDTTRVAQGDSASAAAAQDSKAAADSDRSDAKVFIEAVEIDGKEIFVAGGGVAGKRVRVYANDTLLGDAVVSPNGRFLVQATRDLAVGDYIVRADLLSDNGADVVARAAVPFEREPGEKLSAVAPGTGSGSASQQAAGSASPAQPAVPTGEKAAEAGSGTASGSQQPAGTLNEKAAQAAPAAPGQNESTPAAAANDSSTAQQGTAASEAEGTVTLPSLNNGIAGNAPVVTGPKLETVDGAVIIRRGDTLWQISRRVYGQGIRYSTIYLANQGQIRNPDLIWPGQVFSVPEKTEGGEAADMKAIGDQAVPSDMAGTEPDWRR